MAQWVFDELPPSGARRGGDPSEHAFKHDLGTFVREVIQNANDQAYTPMPRVDLRLRELRGGALTRFREAIAWDALLPHLDAAAQARPALPLGEAVAHAKTADRLRVLYVEDYGTHGLTGHETRGDSHFRALCKDTLYSHKQSGGAGGSYGLGKSVLWTFSGLATVLFHSVLAELPKGRRSPRVIGRAELPSHKLDRHKVERHKVDRGYSGSGWLGEPKRTRGGRRAESLWGEEADALAAPLAFAARSEDRLGTSIGIVDFRDPTSDRDDEDADTLVQRIRQASVRHFWPALVRSRRKLRVGVGLDRTTLVSADEDPVVAPFVDALRRRAQAADKLEVPGDVARVAIRMELPRRRDDSNSTTRGEVDLLVRLARENESHPLLRHVAEFRGPGMVVRYRDRRALGLGVRPFHAVLVCGEAREPGAPTDGDRAIERFLRAAEPPGHDAWHSTRKLKHEYQRGYAKAITQLERRVDAVLRLLLTPKTSQGTRGPDALRRRFPIGPGGGRGEKGASAFRFRKLSARFDGTRWNFEGEIAPVRIGVAWEARLRLAALGEDARPVETLAIERLELDVERPEDAEASLRHGLALIRAAKDTRHLVFRGRTAPVSRSHALAEVGFEMVGESGERI